MTERTQQFDVIIIGGGPAGMSASLWCSDLGMSSVVLEGSSEFGGQLLRTYNPIHNYLGASAESGRELRDRFLEHLEERKLDLRVGAEVKRVNSVDRAVELADGTEMRASAIIFATGIRRRRLGVRGEDDFQGCGMMDSGKRDPEAAAGKRVVVIGGGDAALENALILGPRVKRLTVVHRRYKFSARPDFVDLADKNPRIDFLMNSRVLEIGGTGQVEFVEIEDVATGNRSRLETDAVLVRIGVEPNSEPIRGQAELDLNGFIIVDCNGETSVPGVFAIGDVANPMAPTVSTAAGMGATAAKKAFAMINSNAGR